jgi:hypothetical protein
MGCRTPFLPGESLNHRIPEALILTNVVNGLVAPILKSSIGLGVISAA